MSPEQVAELEAELKRLQAKLKEARGEASKADRETALAATAEAREKLQAELQAALVAFNRAYGKDGMAKALTDAKVNAVRVRADEGTGLFTVQFSTSGTSAGGNGGASAPHSHTPKADGSGGTGYKGCGYSNFQVVEKLGTVEQKARVASATAERKNSVAYAVAGSIEAAVVKAGSTLRAAMTT